MSSLSNLNSYRRSMNGIQSFDDGMGGTMENGVITCKTISSSQLEVGTLTSTTILNTGLITSANVNITDTLNSKNINCSSMTPDTLNVKQAGQSVFSPQLLEQ